MGATTEREELGVSKMGAATGLPPPFLGLPAGVAAGRCVPERPGPAAVLTRDAYLH